MGVKPTVEVPFAGVETYLFDCDEDLYGEEARWNSITLCVRSASLIGGRTESTDSERCRFRKAIFRKKRFTLLRAYGILFEYELAHIQISDTPTIS